MLPTTIRVSTTSTELITGKDPAKFQIVITLPLASLWTALVRRVSRGQRSSPSPSAGPVFLASNRRPVTPVSPFHSHNPALVPPKCPPTRGWAPLPRPWAPPSPASASSSAKCRVSSPRRPRLRDLLANPSIRPLFLCSLPDLRAAPAVPQEEPQLHPAPILPPHRHVHGLVGCRR